MVLIQKFEVEIAGLLETKIRKRNQKKTKEFFHTQWENILNLEECDSRGVIQSGWSRIPKYGMQMLEEFTNYLSMLILWIQCIFYDTFVYAKNSVNKRGILWNEIQSLSTSIDQKEWLILGDFYEVINSSERFS